jgi:hypothetical protein
MSRPQKIHKPLKGDFTQIINAIADGKGVKTSKASHLKNIVKTTAPPKK